jgi:hypothetical protein
MSFTAITNLRIISVVGKGDLPAERVVLRVARECNLTNYIILDSTCNDDGTFSEKNRHVFWFPDLSVSPQDFVVLYTKSGTTRSFVNSSGFTVHVFYWGMKRTVWNEDGDAVSLVHTTRAAFRRV